VNNKQIDRDKIERKQRRKVSLLTAAFFLLFALFSSINVYLYLFGLIVMSFFL
jgi:hypothetical protein